MNGWMEMNGFYESELDYFSIRANCQSAIENSYMEKD